MRKVFLDCGANVGQVLEEFINAKPDFEFFAFEPNKVLIPLIWERVRNYPEGKITIYNKAVWVHDGVADFFLGHHETSTLLLGKRVSEKYHQQIDYDHPEQVECVDFSRWLLETFSSEDYLVTKMDIEGAEYEVLEKMIKDGSIGLIDELYVEWHSFKLDGMPDERHYALLRQLEGLVNLMAWNR